MGVAGDVYVMDAAYATAQQFAKFTPALLKKFLISVQVKGRVNVSKIYETGFALCRKHTRCVFAKCTSSTSTPWWT